MVQNEEELFLKVCKVLDNQYQDFTFIFLASTSKKIANVFVKLRRNLQLYTDKTKIIENQLSLWPLFNKNKTFTWKHEDRDYRFGYPHYYYYQTFEHQYIDYAVDEESFLDNPLPGITDILLFCIGLLESIDKKRIFIHNPNIEQEFDNYNVERDKKLLIKT